MTLTSHSLPNLTFLFEVFYLTNLDGHLLAARFFWVDRGGIQNVLLIQK